MDSASFEVSGGCRSEEEPEAEHEALPTEDQDEVDTTFGPRNGVDARIIERMNTLAAILKNDNMAGEGVVNGDEDAENENRNKKLAELETLLSSFENTEIPLDKLVEPSLGDPVLLRLARHRSSRICRRDFFCPEENRRPK
jgi:hypothetical protein